MKARWMGFVAVGLLLLGAAFILLNFRLISSQSTANSTLTSILGGKAAAGQSFGSFVDGRGQVKKALQARVKDLIQKQSVFGEISDLNVPADQMDISVLYIDVSPLDFFWTPFYARSTYQAVVAYAANRDASLPQQAEPQIVASGAGPVLQVQGTLTLTDTSLGVMSLPGYEEYLAGKLADWAVESVRSQMKQSLPASESD